MARKIRKDITVGGLEKKLQLAPGTIKNLDGSDARSDKKLETLQKETAKAAKKKVERKPTANSVTAKKATKSTTLTADQRTASRRKVKSNPKTTTTMAKKVSSVIKKAVKK